MRAARGAWRYMCDCDMSTPLTYIPLFMDHKNRGNVIIGSRAAPGALVTGESIKRRAMGRVFNIMVQLLALPGIKDSQCGFKLFSARAAQDIFSLTTCQGLGFDVEALYIARLLGYEVIEIPVRWDNDPDTRVNSGKDSLAMLNDLLAIRQNLKMGLYEPLPF